MASTPDRPTVKELLEAATSRQVVQPGDARSGSYFERIESGGQRYLLKRLSPASDWIMRVTGDHVHRPYLVWQAGIMDQAPPSIDHTVVAMEVQGDGDDAELTMVMRDVGANLIPEGDDVITEYQHRRFMECLADLAARFWLWDDGIGLTTMTERLRFFAPDNIAGELAAEVVPAPIAAADTGWRKLAERSPLLWGVAAAVHTDPTMLSDPLAATPHAFLHGDTKMGNLGMHPDGRMILLDWAYPGSGPPCWELCWYLALNRSRLPESKDDASGRYRNALETNGIDTGSWWTTQLDLCIIGIMATFGWEKALGDETELRWWEDRVSQALNRQGLHIGDG